MSIRRLSLLALAAVAGLAALPASAHVAGSASPHAAKVRDCGRADRNTIRVRAKGLTCAKARREASRIHKRCPPTCTVGSWSCSIKPIPVDTYEFHCHAPRRWLIFLDSQEG